MLYFRKIVSNNLAIVSIISAILASLCFSIIDFNIKYLSDKYPLYEIILFRSLFAIVITFIIFVPLEGGIISLKTRRPLKHFIRAMALVLSNFCFFAGLAVLTLAENSAIFFIAPLLITLFSVIFLKEKVGWRRWSALIIGFIGVLLIIQPGQINFKWASLLPLLAAIFYATLHIMTRNLGLSEKATTLSFYIQVAFILVSGTMGLMFGNGQFSNFNQDNLSLMFIFKPWILPSQFDFLIFFIIGLASSIGGYLISQAYRLSEAGLVAPFEYTSLLLAVFWTILIWGIWPSFISWIAIFMIIGSGIFIAIRETNLKLSSSSKRLSGRR